MAKRRITEAEKRYNRERYEHMDIKRLADWAELTGFCPICTLRRRGNGITCGQIDCIRRWLRIPEREVLKRSLYTEMGWAQEQADDEQSDADVSSVD